MVGQESLFFHPALPARPALPALSQSRIDLRPVDDVPPGVDVVGPAVLILEVVRVLPHVDPEQRLLAIHQRVVLVRRALDGELAALVDDPGPAAAEATDGGRLELLLELVEAAERAVERIGNRTGRGAPAFGAMISQNMEWLR